MVTPNLLERNIRADRISSPEAVIHALPSSQPAASAVVTVTQLTAPASSYRDDSHNQWMELTMFTAYVVVSILTAAALTFSATADFVRYEKVLVNMDRADVPRSWLTTLGGLKAAGALGLLVGIGVPPIGTVAAVGVVLFFVGAIITHIRARWYSFSYPCLYLTLATGSLVLGVASS
jgi:DoxX-like family